MKRREEIKSILAFGNAGRYIRNGFLTVLTLFFFGCATVPKPVTIKHEGGGSQSIAAPEQKQRVEPADQSIGALVDLLRSKNMISADEAARFTGHSATRADGQKAPVSGDVAALVELLKSKNMLSADEAARLTNQSGVRPSGENRAAVVPEIEDKERLDKITASITGEIKKSIDEQIKNRVQEELPREVKKAELASAAPDWTRRISFGGDIRLRYERDLFDKNNAAFAQPANPTQLMNTTINQDRYKYRVRFGAEAQVNDQVNAVMVLSTGNTSTPISTNSLIGDFMNKDNVLFDQAYIKWQPRPYITMYGGRMPNPWFSTDLVWSRDLNFEGLALNLRKPFNESWIPFLTVGVFPLQQNDFSKRSKMLTAGQLGLERKSQKGVGAKAGMAYYDFTNITGVRNDPLTPGATDWTAPLFQQKGNTLFNISADPAVVKTAFASEFRELNLTGALDIGFWDPYHVVFLGDYVKNLGFVRSDVVRRTGNPNQPKEIVGYRLGMTVGFPEVQEAGQWKAYLYHKRLESDAVVDAFTDSDFHLGGTNARGWVLGTDVAVLKNFWLTFRWLTADEISGPPLAIDVFQADINVRF